VFLLIYKIACILLFAFCSDATYTWILIIVLAFGSFWNYYKCKVERPYFNETIAILWNITNGVYMWVNGTLLICMILSSTAFSGGIQLIGLGVPLIVAIEFFGPKQGRRLLSRAFGNIDTELEHELYIRYLTQAIHGRQLKEQRTLQVMATLTRSDAKGLCPPSSAEMSSSFVSDHDFVP
jgi:hypothetical protein